MDSSCLSLPEVSRYRCHIPKGDVRPQGRTCSRRQWKTGIFPLTDHQPPDFQSEESWRCEKDCQRDLLVCWEFCSHFWERGAWGAAASFTKSQKRGAVRQVNMARCSWDQGELVPGEHLRNRRDGKGTTSVLEGFFCHTALFSLLCQTRFLPPA